MSGIFGVWHLDGRPVDAQAFDRSLSRMVHHETDRSSVWLRDSVGLGCCVSLSGELPNSPQPAVFGDLACVFDGRLDNRANLLSAIRDHPLGIDECSDAQLVVAAYDRYPDRFPSLLEGDFALAVFDRRTRRLTLARDPVGVRPLCYAQFGATFMFATDAKPLLALPGITAAPDDEMLAEFILYFPSAEARTRTFFGGIRSLPPAHLAVLADRHLSVRKYFEFDWSRQTRLSDFHEYGAAFAGLFECAVRRRMRGQHPVSISVSGGLDSSYIFSVADRLAGTETEICNQVFGLNYGGEVGSPSDESAFIEELRRSCKAPIERIEYQPGFMTTALEDAWHSESPDIEGIGVTHRALMNRADERGAKRMLTGHWGDQFLVSWDYLVDLINEGNWSLFEKHRNAWGIDGQAIAKSLLRDFLERIAPAAILATSHHLRSYFDARCAAPWFTPRFRELLKSRFRAPRLERIRGTCSAWYVYKQCRLSYQVHCMEWNARIAARSGLEIAFPFLDRDLIQFLMSIPGEIQSHEGIPRNLMREAMRGLVPEAIVNRRDKGVFTHLGNESIESDFERIRELLGPRCLAVEMGYFEGPVLWKNLDEWRAENLRSDTSIVAWRITELCGFEAFLRSFFGPQTR